MKMRKNNTEILENPKNNIHEIVFGEKAETQNNISDKKINYRAMSAAYASRNLNRKMQFKMHKTEDAEIK